MAKILWIAILAAASAAAQIVEGTVTNLATGSGIAGAKDAAFLQKAVRLTVRAGETTQATLSLSGSR
jgi:hypothetical protein